MGWIHDRIRKVLSLVVARNASRTRLTRKPLRFHLEHLEDRCLLAGGLLAAPANLEAPGLDGPAQTGLRRELVFIDESVPDYQALVRDLAVQDGNARGVDVAILRPDQNGLDQISAVLAGYSQLDAVHVVSHGGAGAVQLGNFWLNQETAADNATALQGWGSALGQDADLVFHGCQVAGDEAGQGLMQNVRQLTGADVAASTDATGAADLGGNWDLEYALGNIDAGPLFSQPLRSSWDHLLLTIQPVSWNVIGLDSNNVNAGPNQFLVGVRVTNDQATTATNVVSNFIWDSANANINLSGATTLSVPSLAPGASTDFYYNVAITRTSAAYNTTRRYHIKRFDT